MVQVLSGADVHLNSRDVFITVALCLRRALLWSIVAKMGGNGSILFPWS